MMKLKFTVFLLAVALLFSGCPFGSDDEDDNPLLGKWVFTSYTEITYEDGTLDETYEDTYNPALDNYFTAEIIEFQENKVFTYYNNDDDNTYEYFDEDYEVKKNKILVNEEEVPFRIENNVLIIETVDEFEWDGKDYLVEITDRYTKYTGPIPPESWTTPLTNDTYENDNTAENATPITVNADPQSHTLTTGDEDWFTFNTTAGKKYLIIVGSYTDVVIRLYDDQLRYITYDDDNDRYIEVNNFGYDVQSVLWWEAEESKQLYFKVEGYTDTNTGYYAVAVVETTYDPFAKSAGTEEKKEQIERKLRSFTK